MWQNKHLLIRFPSSEPFQGVTGITQNSTSLREPGSAALPHTQYALVRCMVSVGSMNYFFGFLFALGGISGNRRALAGLR